MVSPKEDQALHGGGTTDCSTGAPEDLPSEKQQGKKKKFRTVCDVLSGGGEPQPRLLWMCFALRSGGGRVVLFCWAVMVCGAAGKEPAACLRGGSE